MEFTKEQHEAVSAAIREAEQHTCGQIICVLARSSSAYAHIPILWASALALITPWPLIDFTPWSVQRIFLVQLVVFLVAALVFSWMPLRLLLVPRPAQRARAHRAAIEQFVVRRVAHTKNRCGILIFISLAEHYARIIADEGIAQKVPNAEWQAAGRRLDQPYAYRGNCGGIYCGNRALRIRPRRLRPARRVGKRIA